LLQILPGDVVLALVLAKAHQIHRTTGARHDAITECVRCRFPLSLRMVEELLAARGVDLTYETVRRWSVKFGLGIARRIRSTALA
jgi:hypothetical protein